MVKFPELLNEVVSFFDVSENPAPTSHFRPLSFQPAEIVDKSVKMKRFPLKHCVALFTEIDALGLSLTLTFFVVESLHPYPLTMRNLTVKSPALV